MSIASSVTFTPFVQPLPSQWTRDYCWHRLRHLPHGLLLESSMRHAARGRYSFLTADPVVWITNPDDLFTQSKLRRDWQLWTTLPCPGLPPFQGGLAGVLNYELNRYFERLPNVPYSPFELPALALGLYDFALAWDHEQNAAWLVSQGLPETTLDRRQQAAENRATQIMELLSAAQPTDVSPAPPPPQPLNFAPQFPVGNIDLLTSNFSSASYRAAVEHCRRYILAGDIFQVNLSQQLLMPQPAASHAIYQRLAERNAAPFAGYFDLGSTQIISASPERFVGLRDGRLETRPIKGTRRRTGDLKTDTNTRRELLASTKDVAENTMIVDLMRNDLSRVSTDESVVVTQYCEAEFYETVIHLVSAIEGQLRPGEDIFSALAAMFPGGSVTGAPKIRSMEIISELEQSARGPYCGCLGYIGLDGSADFNILIRTITACGGWLQIPVGGAVVADSIPEQELAETWIKAQGLLQAIVADC